MDQWDARLHRTWVQLLVDHDLREIAAIAVDANVIVESYGSVYPQEMVIELPTSVYGMVTKSDQIKNAMERALRVVSEGHVYDQDRQPVDDLPIDYRVKIVEVEEGWQEVIRNLIANAQDPNQGVITEKVFSRRQQQPHLYNEMKFGSNSEIRIAQEFESRGVLFFPLPLAVRAETGNRWEDHREPDFLVCHDGAWGILEVAGHQPDRYEKDKDKDAWFKKSGILCVEHYPAERCYDRPGDVVDEFLSILAKHKK